MANEDGFKHRLIRGRVVDRLGRPLASMEVRLVAQTLRDREVVGHGTTDPEGRFEIRHEGCAGALVVGVLGHAQQVVAESMPLFETSDETEIEIVVPRVSGEATLWEELVAAVDLQLAGVAAHELTADDVAFLAGATGHDPVVLDRFVSAHQLACENDLDVAVVFALLQQGLPNDVCALAAAGPDVHQASIAEAVTARTIPAETGQHAAEAVAALGRAATTQPVFLTRPEVLYAATAEIAIGQSDAAKLVNARLDDTLRIQLQRAIGKISSELDRAVHAQVSRQRWQECADQSVAQVAAGILTQVGGDAKLADEARQAEMRVTMGSTALVRNLLHLDEPLGDNPALTSDVARGKAAEYARLAGLGDEATRAVVERSTALAGGDSGALAALVAKGKLQKDEAAALESVLELGKLSADNLPLIRALDTRSTTSLRALARWDAAEWTSLFEEEQIPLPPGETAASYADNIVTNLESAYPALALAARIGDGTLDAVLERNPGFDLRRSDLVTEDGLVLDWGGVPDEQRPPLQQRLRAIQRVLALADTTADRALLLDRKYDSAVTIASQTEDEFVAKSGLAIGPARLTYARAQDAAETIAHGYAAFRDLVGGQFSDLAVGNIYPELINELRRIDGFTDLFGPQDFCTCDDCHSIFSPAAYFCDLMHFVEKWISRPVFVTQGLTSHPLYLKTRRPDLWTLQLSCENTQTLIPYLTIANEVLEAFLDAVIGGDIYATLADPNDKVSFRTPVDLPFAELRLYLSHFALSPADVYRTLRLPDEKIWRARLGLAADEATVIAKPDAAGVVQRLGGAPLANTKVQDFLRVTGLTRQQLDDVLSLRSNADLGAVTIVKQEITGELQNFEEVIQNLTDVRVDFIHRFLRLWRTSSWEFQELDLLLLSLREGGLTGPDLDENVIEQLGQLADLQSGLRLTAEELCALPDSLPVSRAFPLPPPRREDRRLYERLFDLPKLFDVKDEATGELNQSVTFHHYSLNTLDPSDTKVDEKTPLLLGALGINETELLLLLDLLKGELLFDPGGDCTLDRSKLSLLFRHARVARALHLSIDDLIRALHILFDTGEVALSSLDRIRQLLAFRSWLRSSPFSTSELRFILEGLESGPVKFKNTLDTVAQVVLQVQSASGTPPLDALHARLAALFNVTTSRLDAMLAWVSADVTAQPIADALTVTFTNGAAGDPSLLEPLLELIHQLERVATLFSNLKLADDAVAYLTANQSALGTANLKSLTLHDVQSFTLYRTLATMRDDGEPQVQAALAAYLSAGTIPAGDERARAADLWQVDVSLLDSLVETLQLPSVPIDAFARLNETLALCVTLGVNGSSLQLLGEDATLSDLKQARDVALGAFASKYEDEQVRADRLEPYQDRINVLRRDALCDYLIARQPSLNFRDHTEIYNYFLLDVDMSGCFRTSRVVAAISSLQLYVQRCLLNLEQTDPSFSPKVNIDPSALPADQWEWRKNYRVWEANRKVFLYPESYIDPDLRDDKTPIALDLENDVLQRKITKKSAEEAYQRYLTQSAELSHLRICGSLLHNGTYFFFGRTQHDPAIFYSRQWDGTTWTPWKKVDLPIDAASVAAAVHRGRLFLFWVNTNSKKHTTIADGSSSDDYYEVSVTLVYSMLTPEGKWTAPQKLERLFPSKDEYASVAVEVNGIDRAAAIKYDKRAQKVYPHVTDGGTVLTMRYYNGLIDSGNEYDSRLDLFHNNLVPGDGIPALPTKSVVLLSPTESTTPATTEARLGIYQFGLGTEPQFDLALDFGSVLSDLLGPPLSYITEPFPYHWYLEGEKGPHSILHLVNGAYPEALFTLADQQYLIQDSSRFLLEQITTPSLSTGVSAVAVIGGGANGVPSSATSFAGISITKVLAPALVASKWRLVRLSTSVADDLGEKLMAEGLDAFFSLDTQAITEKKLGMTITDTAELQPPADDTEHLDFRGAFGGYFRESFLHIPWLTGFHLNANQEFEHAKAWYERIFDPTAKESPQDAKPSDRNWRYIEFRNLTLPSLKQILTDAAAINAYETDPFNPYAIARLRPTAFQKAIVMHYVSNLLDWGDSLFAEDTMESLNEAEMLYVLASEILGKRPIQVGACDVPADSELTYEKIGPGIDKGSEFLVTIENWTYTAIWQVALEMGAAGQLQNGTSHMPVDELAPLGSIVAQKASAMAPQRRATLRPYSTIVEERARFDQLLAGYETKQNAKHWPGIDAIVQSRLVFCVPPNDVLLSYWDRVEDRLYKIRNCLNLSGVRRQLALFAPPINPMSLVRAKAAGLSLEEALAALTAPAPPYRFAYLIDRARQAAQAVQSFGAALLSALEKKDVEDLTLLRSVHERTLLAMTKDVKTRQVEEAQSTLQSLVESKANVQAKIDYLQGLLAGGLTRWETSEQANRRSSTTNRQNEQRFHALAAALYFIPQSGSPFSMKYGGKELGDAASAGAQWMGSTAAILDGLSTAAGVEATFQRRANEWQQSLTQAQGELRQIEQQRLAADKRATIAQNELDIHQTTMDQADEIFAFYGEKFTNLGLYNYLATTLTRLHHEAYNVAHDLATMTERAYRFERGDDTAFIAPDNWQFERAGLLAGERLALQLQQMETEYLRQNIRDYEVTQSFSLALIDPGALLALRATGTCDFKLPEILYDLAYPGQYKRLLRAIRITLPCVAGPYTNVAAKLTLKESKVRIVPTTDPADLVGLPPETTPSIATSSAQNDAGVFEFGFRDERYLPFEGAGAVESRWGLELPSQLRLFDYNTISDVIVHVSYRAQDDDAFGVTVESQIVDTLTQYAATEGMHRLFSVRHDFPNAFQLLLYPAGAEQTTDFQLGPQHFPYFLAQRNITISEASVYLQSTSDAPVDTTGLTITVNGTPTGAWTVVADTTLSTADVPLSGAAFHDWTLAVTGGSLDPADVADLQLLLKYAVT